MDRLPSAPDGKQAIVIALEVEREGIRLSGKALLEFFSYSLSG